MSKQQAVSQSIIEKKIAFIEQIRDKIKTSDSLQENTTLRELFAQDTQRIISKLFQTRTQDRGLRLTSTGFTIAKHVGIDNCEYRVEISNLSSYSVFLIDCSKHMPAPYYIRSFYPLEICVLDASCCTAITLVGGFMEFLAARINR